ncbi:MAG: DegT/DnrJ/EryC1/StrS family aminotransferase [Nitrospirae bacterium]|nr:DegT/DnrJ/EryC1/StrS family aminotransferase [Nitrospirota bacterium]
MQVQFHKAYITDDEIAEVVDSLKSGWLTMGPKTVKFEEEFKKYIGSKHAVAVNSCTSALHLALRAIDLKSVDEVIIPTTTFTATGEVVCYFNARPVIVDIEKDTNNINVKSIEEAVTSKTKAIIPVHHGGQPCDMDEIMEIAKRYNLYVIEDAAHCPPSWYKGRQVGAIGDITCFSFYATKTAAAGEGGMITTENDEWAERMKILRLHGISKDPWKRYSKDGSWYYEVVEAGFKYNTTDIQSGIGLAQMRKIEWTWQRRRYIAERYNAAFQETDAIITPYIKPDRIPSYHLYVIKLNLEALTISRNRFIDELSQRGISTSVHFIPLHRHPFYERSFGCKAQDFPNAEWVYERSISLPIYPGMTDAEIDYVIENVMDICKISKRWVVAEKGL